MEKARERDSEVQQFFHYIDRIWESVKFRVPAEQKIIVKNLKYYSFT